MRRLPIRAASTRAISPRARPARSSTPASRSPTRARRRPACCSASRPNRPGHPHVPGRAGDVAAHDRRAAAAGARGGRTSRPSSSRTSRSSSIGRCAGIGRRGRRARRRSSSPAPSLDVVSRGGRDARAFDLFYLLQNPSPTQTAQVQIRYLLPVRRADPADPRRRAEHARDHLRSTQQPGLGATDVSAVITSLNGVPIIVERAMYSSAAGTFAAGHDSAGVTSPSLDWFFAEGATGGFFDMFLLLANPNGSPANVHATYLLPSGQTVQKDYTVPANSRRTLNVQLEDAQLAATSVSTRLTSTNGVSFIAERSMWWPHGQAWFEAHNAAGATTTGTKWAVGGRRGRHACPRTPRRSCWSPTRRRSPPRCASRCCSRPARPLAGLHAWRPTRASPSRSCSTEAPAERRATCGCRAGRGSARWSRAWRDAAADRGRARDVLERQRPVLGRRLGPAGDEAAVTLLVLRPRHARPRAAFGRASCDPSTHLRASTRRWLRTPSSPFVARRGARRGVRTRPAALEPADARDHPERAEAFEAKVAPPGRRCSRARRASATSPSLRCRRWRACRRRPCRMWTLV